MFMEYCEICGKSIDNKFSRMTKEKHKEFLSKHREGFFQVHYDQAVVDENDQVISMSYAEGFSICPDCAEIAHEAVQKAFDPIIKKRQKSVTLKTAKFPRDPIQNRGRCMDAPCNPF